jgi:Glycosyl transferase family 11
MTDLVVSRLSGGLGNQLFQYAAACGIAHRARRRVTLDVSSFDEVHDGRVYLLERYVPPGITVNGSTFDPMYQTATVTAGPDAAISRLPVYRENNYQFEPEAMALRGSVYLYGFWQSWKYFDTVADTLRARILVASASGPWSRAAPDGETVAVHVRRGDYLVPDVLEAFGLCEPVYYRAAMALLRERLARPRFLVFSEDPHWCAEHLADRDVTIVSGRHADVHADLARMARCHHHIISNSSLGWWGAWLAAREDAIVVAPIPWYSQSPHAQDLPALDQARPANRRGRHGRVPQGHRADGLDHHPGARITRRAA